MTQTIIKVPAAGAFDPTDIEITDNTSGAFLVKEGSNEYIRIDTTNGSEQIVLKGRPGSAANAKLVMSDQPFIQGSDQQNIQMTSSGIFANVSGSSGKRFQIRASGTNQYFEIQRTGNVPGLRQDADSAFTYTLDDASGAVFKIVDDDSSPRTYFTATENGIVEVDGVKITANIGGSTTASIGIGNLAFNTTQTGFGSSVAIGDEAGKNQSSGHSTVLIGRRAGQNLTTPNGVVAIGTATMETNEVTGNNNTTCGAFSMRAVSSGANNTALGKSAGDSITTGSGNTAIGYDSDCAAAGTNQIAIGNGVVESTNNRASIGDSSNVATLDFSSSGNSWSNTSDVRIKENIQDSDLGLAFINSLRPVKHTSKDPAQWPEEIRPAEPSDRTPEQLEAVKDGLIAQEVKAAADALGTTFSGWEQESNGLNRLQYERFVVPLIKAVQELSAQVEELKGDK